MDSSSSKKPRETLNGPRGWLIESLRLHLVPVFIERGFAIAPIATRNEPVDRELVSMLPFGRLCRSTSDFIDLAEIELANRGRAEFRISAGVAPKEGLMTRTGHWAAEELLVGWLSEFYEMYSSPWWRRWFSIRPRQVPRTKTDYEKLVVEVAGFVPEIESALRGGKLGPHMRRVRIRR
jgi:hypothetical protein